MSNAASAPSPDPFLQRIARLTALSRGERPSPYSRFDWSDRPGADAWWMSPELLSLNGTRQFQESDDASRRALSKWECVNLCSVTVHGIRELLLEVIRRMQTGELGGADDYLHHFVEEENQHMWFFAEFCKRLGGKIYPNRIARLNPEPDPLVEQFLVFARIYIFEEVGDYFNVQLARDERLHPLVRAVNRAHHEDESRHIAFGQAMLSHVADAVASQRGEATLRQVGRRLLQFMQITLESLYNPSAYRDAGLTDVLDIRRQALACAARRELHRRALARANRLFIDRGFFTRDELDEFGPFAV